MNERSDKVETIFAAALQMASPEARAKHLDKACAGDADLRRMVEELIEADGNAGSFLESPAGGPPSTSDMPGIAERVGTVVGRYKLLQELGEGGMGTVFMAEQIEPVKRRVAVKIIKQGMDTRQFIARFEAERQALAMMDHPNIARVLDAGCTDTGWPYFVMELVKGIPITRFCDENRLTTRQRLELFVSVCQAVQHAHQKGIIHRDLKPSNVLVALYDDRPVPKIIDFGVAKTTNQPLTEKTLFTQIGQIVGTLEYMSPEQAVLNQLDVDTRSDVYSLGVILYELLTGVTPVESGRLRTAALDETLRIIREEEPPKPSTRVSSLGERATAMAAYRGVAPERLATEIRGDLDWIAMKALAKERSRRYDSASRLADDVERFLNHQLVQARAPSTWYQLWKFYERNKILATSVAAVIVALSLGLAVAIWGFQEAREQAVAARLSESRAIEQERRALSLAVQAKELVIGQALLQAFSGQVEEVRKTVSEYQDLFGTQDEWPAVLVAAACLHRADYVEAHRILKPIVDQESASIPAVALWSTLLLHQGHWNAAMEAGNRVRNAEPRAGKFHDLDKAFVGYGLVFLDCQRAEKELSEVVARHPTWLFCHSVLADIWAHLGVADKDRKKARRLLEDAVRKVTATKEFVPDSFFTVEVNLFARKCLIELNQADGLEYSELRKSADAAAEQLSRFPNFHLGMAMRAQYFDVIGDQKTAEALWKQLLEHGNGLHSWTAMGRLYRDRSAEDMFALLDSLPEAQGHRWIRAAKAYLLTDIPGKKKQAMEIFQELRDNNESSMSDRYMDVYIPLLLGEKDTARAVAREWRKKWDEGDCRLRSTESEFGEERLMKIIGEWEAPDLEQSDRAGTLITHQILGLMAVADGDRKRAEQEFEKSVEKPYVNLDYYWAEAFLQHLRKDKAWPRENQGMASDKALSGRPR